jgi:hypothetical protein
MKSNLPSCSQALAATAELGAVVDGDRLKLTALARGQLQARHRWQALLAP